MSFPLPAIDVYFVREPAATEVFRADELAFTCWAEEEPDDGEEEAADDVAAAMPAVQSLTPLYKACVVAAVAGGSTVCSHFNDSGFWLVKSLVGLDETTTLKTWTIMETLVGVSGFVVALIISLCF